MTAFDKQTKTGWGRFRCDGVMLLGLAVFYLPIIRNTVTPAGDGNRTVPYLEAIASTGELLPTWNPNKFGGLPFLADPHSFLWLAAITRFDPGTINLQLNLLIFGSLILIGLSGAYFLRSMAIRPAIAACGGFMLATSELIIVLQSGGTVTILYSYAAMLLVMGLAISDARTPNLGKVAALAVLLGIVAAARVHYALPFLVLLFALVVVFVPIVLDEDRRLGRCAQRLLRMSIAGLLGLGLQTVFIVQMAVYNLGSDGTFPDRWVYPFDIASLSALVTPIHVGNLAVNAWLAFPFINVAVAVSAVLAIALWQNVRRRRELGFWLACFCACIACLIGQAALAEVVSLHDIRQALPIIGRLRQPLPFMWLITIAAIAASAIVFDDLLSREGGTRQRTFGRGAVAAYLIIVALSAAYLMKILWFDAGLATVWRDEIRDQLLPWGVASTLVGLAMIAVLIVVGGRRRTLLLPIVLFCCAAQFAFMYSRVGATEFNGRTMVTDNTASLPEIYRYLSAEQAYFRVGCRHYKFGCDDNGIQSVQGWQGFSMTFPPEHKVLTELLTGVWPKVERPHWAGRNFDCSSYDQIVSEMMNIRYLICNRSDDLDSNWQSVLTEKDVLSRDWTLWERGDWTGVPRVFFNWRETDDVSPATAIIRTAWETGEAFVSPPRVNGDSISSWPDPDQPDRRPVWSGSIEPVSASELRVNVVAPVSGLVVLPDYWDRGWMAEVNGIPTPVAKAFGAFRSVFVEAGPNEITFSYRPPYWHASLACSLISLCIVTLFACTGVLNRKRQRKGAIAQIPEQLNGD